MATIQENIARLQQAKEDIKTAIENKGVSVDEGATIDAYAAKIDEIEQLEGDNPWAVDFGEEIASGNPEFVGALQEDIDYYNQIQEERRLYAEGKGGRTDKEILLDPEFRRRIAWWPFGMKKESIQYLNCGNLTEIADYVPVNLYNVGSLFRQLKRIRMDVSNVTDAGLVICSGTIDDIDLTFSRLSQTRGAIFQHFLGKRIKLNFPSLEEINAGSLSFIRGVRVMYVSLPKLKTCVTMFRELYELEELYLDIHSLVSATYFIYNFSSLRIAEIRGMKLSINLKSHKNISVESVKFILNHCQAREDGAGYTLTLHVDVKEAFEAKCSEDAGYAASLANAVEKGLTLA